MKIILLVPCLFALKLAEAGYYKIRPPPPPPIPPASIHYGPHPPAVHLGSAPSYIYPHRLPPPPIPVHPHSRYISHVPHHHHTQRKPHIHKSSLRDHPPPRLPLYHPPPPKLNNFHQWKTSFNTFRAPVIKETFNPPPTVSYHTPTYIKDDDKGPIHTIPAPNLGPTDNSHIFQNEFNIHPKKQDPDADLAAILKHGIHQVNVPHSSGYQVTEDPSVHSGQSDAPSYFAPDPDPSVPTVKVPTTTDPHSLPSNGQVPLDLYLQQQAEKVETSVVAQQQQQQQQQLQHHSALSSATATNDNTLTAQDLFNLLNYQPSGGVNLIPQTQLQQHILQPNIQFYNQGLLLPQYQAQDIALNQQQQQQFQPQYQTFNYDERTQQGAYGSNSFPSSSMNIQINSGGHNDLYDAAASALLDNSVAGSEREEVYHNEITNPQSGSERKSGEKRDEKSISKPYVVNSSTKYTTKTSQQQQHKTISTTQRTNDNSLTNQPNDENIPKNDESKKPEANNDRGNSKEINEPKPVATIKPDDNVQLQKSIQIYESSYPSPSLIKQENEDESKEFINYNQNIESDKKTGRGIVIGQVITESINPQTESDITDDQIPFGTRIRPKRF